MSIEEEIEMLKGRFNCTAMTEVPGEALDALVAAMDILEQNGVIFTYRVGFTEEGNNDSFDFLVFGADFTEEQKNER